MKTTSSSRCQRTPLLERLLAHAQFVLPLNLV